MVLKIIGEAACVGHFNLCTLSRDQVRQGYTLSSAAKQLI